MIYVDDREDGKVLEMFAKTGLDVEVKRLKCGDYVCDELGVVIERKSIDDFCGSIMDGRLKSQADRMLEQYENCFVLIAGRIGDRKTEINENCILGMMSSLVMKGIHVVCLDNEEQLVFFMKRIFERFTEMNGGEKK